FSAALRFPGDPWIQENRSTIDKALAGIRAKLGRLMVETSPQSASVFINGSRVEREPGAFAYVKPGSTLIEVKEQGYISDSTTVIMLAGASERVVLTLRPDVAPAAVRPVALP